MRLGLIRMCLLVGMASLLLMIEASTSAIPPRTDHVFKKDAITKGWEIARLRLFHTLVV